MLPFDLLLGTAGLVCLLAAFALEEFTAHTHRETVLYNALNLLGGILLLWYSILLQSIPFIALNAVWAVFAGSKLVHLGLSHGKPQRKTTHE